MNTGSPAAQEQIIGEKIQNFSIRSILRLLKEARVPGEEKNIPQVVITTLVDKIKAESNWYALFCYSTTVPYIKDGKGFLFTDKEMADNAVTEMSKRGELVTAVNIMSCDENAVFMMLRYGVQEISINKGANGSSFNSADLIGDKYKEGIAVNKQGVSKINPSLTKKTSILSDALNSEFEPIIKDAEELLAHKLARHFVYTATYRGTKNEEPMIEFVEQKDDEGNVVSKDNIIYIYSDVYEFNKVNIGQPTIPVATRLNSLRSKFKNAIFVLNRGSSNILIGEDIINFCDEYDSLNDVLYRVALKEYKGDAIKAREAAEEILDFEEICTEFITSNTSNGFIYPEDGVSAAGYSAIILQKTAAGNPVDVYRLLTRIKKNPTNAKNIIAAGIK